VEDGRVTPLEGGPHRARRLAAGILSGLFGVGGGIVMTPGPDRARRAAAHRRRGYPAARDPAHRGGGAFTYHRAGEVDMRAAAWISLTGAAASAIGALLTEAVERPAAVGGHRRAPGVASRVQILRGDHAPPRSRSDRSTHGRSRSLAWWQALLSGLLGIGGGLVIVPALAGMLACR
jgi:hypothetical protein